MRMFVLYLEIGHCHYPL